MAKKPETILKEKWLPKLRALPGSWVVKIQQVAIRGTPDVLMCLCGVFVAIEFKTDEGKLDPLQKRNLDLIGRAGGISLIVTPSNSDETFKFLADVAKKVEVFNNESSTMH